MAKVAGAPCSLADYCRRMARF